MTWTYPLTLWGFLMVPVLLIAALFSSRRSRSVLNAMGQNSIEWQVRTFLRDVSMMSFFLLSVLAAAEPRGGRKPVTGERSGLDVSVAFDVSRSMLAEDIIPSRLEKSITALRQITRTLADARFSLIPFKGNALLVVPMTEDRVMLDLWIDRLGPGLSTVAGTDIEAALFRAEKSFPGGDGRSKVIVLITDGEALKGHIEKISRRFADKGIPVYTLASGTEEGSTIPLGDRSWVKDADGYPVISRSNITSLKRLSDITGGSFYNLSYTGATADLITDIDNTRMFSEKRGIRFIASSRFRFFLFPALMFLFFYLLTRIIPWRRR